MRNDLFTVLIIFVAGCTNVKEHSDDKNGKTFESIRYSSQFGILNSEGYKEIFHIHGHDTQWGLKFYKDATPPRIAVLSTVFAGFIELLGEQKQIVAVDNEKFYSDKIILKGLDEGSIAVVGEEGQLQIEKLLAQKPDYLVCSTFEFNKNTTGERLEKLGIKILYCDNFKEQHPLARAEWIKFFGVLTGRFVKADSLFKVVENRYNEIVDKCKNDSIGHSPKVLADAMYGESWFVPGGNSFTAQLIKDAGGEYVFRNKQPLFTYPLALEEVYTVGKEADIWIHTNQYNSLEALRNADRRYTMFKPYINRKIYNNDRRENEFGGNDFWETGVGRPDLIVSDLYKVFHVNSSVSDSTFYYYRKLE